MILWFAMNLAAKLMPYKSRAYLCLDMFGINYKYESCVLNTQVGMEYADKSQNMDVQQPFFDFDFDSDRPAHSIIKMSCTGWWPVNSNLIKAT